MNVYFMFFKLYIFIFTLFLKLLSAVCPSCKHFNSKNTRNFKTCDNCLFGFFYCQFNTTRITQKESVGEGLSRIGWLGMSVNNCVHYNNLCERIIIPLCVLLFPKQGILHCLRLGKVNQIVNMLVFFTIINYGCNVTSYLKLLLL